MMIIDNRFDLGQFVYLKTDVEQMQRIVTGMTIRQNGNLCFELSCGREVSHHYDFEITAEENTELKVK